MGGSRLVSKCPLHELARIPHGASAWAGKQLAVGPGRPTCPGGPMQMPGGTRPSPNQASQGSNRRNLDKESEYMTTGVAMTNELDKQSTTEGARNWTKLLA